jgi:hypothetical protein
MKKRLESGSGFRQKYEGADLPAVADLSAIAAVANEDAAKSEAAAAKVGISAKAHFSARLIFLPSFRWTANREAQSKSVKVRQTDPVGRPTCQIICKYLKMNDLQQNRCLVGSRSVKPGQTTFKAGKHQPLLAFLKTFRELRAVAKQAKQSFKEERDVLPLPIQSRRAPAQFPAWPAGGAAHLSIE